MDTCLSLEQDVETKTGNGFILLILFLCEYAFTWEQFFLLTSGTNLFKLQSKGFIHAQLKIRYDLWKKQTCLFSNILGSHKILYMLLMTFLCTSLSDSTILGQHLVLIG